MALSRFFSDALIERIGMKKTYILSASVISIGIATAIIFPTFWPAMIGFCLVGFGTSSVFPMTFALAGSSKKYSPGMAMSILGTYGIIGMLIGPPLIGYLAHAFDLKISFLTFVLSGVMLVPISQLFFRHRKQIEGY
jgi:MFS family permease